MLTTDLSLIFTVIFISNVLVFVHSSFSKPPECGSSNNCPCKPGYWGGKCQFCRLRLTSDTGVITDGAGKYSESSKCSWLIQTSRPNSTIELELEQFATECAWDHLYIFAGNSVHAPLKGTISGLLRDQSITAVANEPIRRMTIKSNAAFLYFFSDANYVVTGFNIKYSIKEDCSSQCSFHGNCDSHGNCVCVPGWAGSSCNVATCLKSCVSGTCDTVTRKCQGCKSGFTGPTCNSTVGRGFWTNVPAKNQDIVIARASHAASLVGDWLWVYGGYSLNVAPFNDLIRYRISSNTWEVVTPHSSIPVPSRLYGHSMIAVNESLVVFGGNVHGKAVNELWSFDTTTQQWSQLPYSNRSAVEPLAVSGHTATLVDDKMIVIFGYGPKEGYTQKVQVFDLVSREWRIHNVSVSLVRATFGHSSAFDPVSKMIYVHGGIRKTYGHNDEISSEMTAYIPSQNKWITLLSSGYQRFLHTSVLIGNLLLVFGGNTHNDTSDAKKQAKCYSNEALQYDTRCNVWTRVKSKTLTSQLARYGHAAVQANGTMYIVGGFQGTMLNDVLTYTIGGCSAWKNRSSCLQNYPSYGCVRSINTGTCIGPLSAQTQSNNIEKPVCPANPNRCSAYYTCKQCASSAFQCEWCQGKCQAASMQCRKTAILDSDLCPPVSSPQPVVPGSCPGLRCGYIRCDNYTSCKGCTDNKNCIWCESQQTCVGLHAYVVSFPYGQCQEWTNEKCSEVRCDAMKTCNDCHTLPGCGWCDDGSGTGLGKCIGGGDDGPFSMSTNSSSISKQCMPKDNKNRWYFIECPACQCNGHSTCDLYGNCKQCKHNTNGTHCQTCSNGYFGDSKNGGTCQPCKCNGHSSSCTPHSGVCYCNIKGIIGNNCERCAIGKGYYGNSTNGGHCFYNLTSGYMFTFNVTGTSGISFLNVPKREDRNVQFTLTVSSEQTALMNITFKTKSSPEKVLLSAVSIGKYEHSFKHDDFDFRSASHFTFFVYVYNIKGKCTIEISFSQITPFMLLKFFLTFFGCFFSILMVTFIAWKIRVRYNNYVMRRQRTVEMHQMANRPSSTLKIILENHDTMDFNQVHAMPAPVTLQPFAKETIAVATIVIRPPVLSNGLTPHGQTGLYLGTVLVDRDHRVPPLRYVRCARKKVQKRASGLSRCV